MRALSEALLVSLWVGVPTPIYRAFWLIWPDAGAAVQTAFEEVYGLETATVIVDELEIEVVRPIVLALGFWVGASAYMADPESLCFDGCGQSTVP